MPIAFDPPTHASHGTLPARGARSREDDPASLDIFTQLLLAAANVQDAAGAPETPVRAAKDATANAADPSVLTLPLPAPLLAGAVPVGRTVTIVASEKVGEVRATPSGDGRALVDALRATRADSASGTTVMAPPVGVAGTAAPAVAAAPAIVNGHQPSPQSTAAALATQADTSPSTEAPREPASARPNDALSAAANALAPLTTPVTVTAAKPGVGGKASEAPATAAVQAATPALLPPLPPVHVETIAAPAFTPGWQDEAVNKLAHIVLTRNERAELKLNPAELGPVNVRVEMRADQVSVHIVAASAETRSALEQSLPQLRDLLASQGITLGQTSVQDGAGQRDARNEPWGTPARNSSVGSTADAVAPDTVHAIVRRADRLLDLYA